MKTIQTVAAYTAEHGGGTFEAGTLLPFEPTRGYAVGLADGTAATTRNAADLDRAAKAVASEWVASFVGTWLAEDGSVHVDPVAYIIDRESAERLARENHQIAIYDYAAGESIEL